MVEVAMGEVGVKAGIVAIRAGVVAGTGVARIGAGTVGVGVGMIGASVGGADMGGRGVRRASVEEAGVGGAGVVLVGAGVDGSKTRSRSRPAQISLAKLRWISASSNSSPRRSDSGQDSPYTFANLVASKTTDTNGRSFCKRG